MRVAFAYNVKKNKPSIKLEEQKDLEFDSPFVINSIKDALTSLGHEVFMVEADENAFIKLKKLKSKIDIVFNIAEGLWGDARESQIPMYCEVLQIPYTHSGPTTHGIGLDKAFTKLVLKGADNINVPDSHVVTQKNYKIPSGLKFPLIVKPNKEGSSKGVLDANVVNNQKDLDKRIEIVSENFTKEVLVEEYIEGREFTVAVVGNGNNWQILPIIEQKFDFLPKGMNRIASFELKWLYEDSLKDLTEAYDCPAKLTPKLKKNIEETCANICRLLDVRDCSRIDFRLNEKEELYFIEINTLPGINPDESGISYFPLAARTAGMKYKDLIEKILDLACERYGIK
jgi:D-alanine-D-alanine ligase